jgi:hypothetical protein
MEIAMSLNESATQDAGRASAASLSGAVVPGAISQARGATVPPDDVVWGANTRRFLERAVAWPAVPDEDPGYVNIHYLYLTDRGATVCGRPYKTVQSCIAGIARLLRDPKVTDIWYCTSLQKKCGTAKNGYVFAERKQTDALYMKSLWIDIDVKPEQPDKGYATFKDALKAFQQFYKQYGLPTPSCLIKSGGGRPYCL